MSRFEKISLSQNLEVHKLKLWKFYLCYIIHFVIQERLRQYLLTLKEKKRHLEQVVYHNLTLVVIVFSFQHFENLAFLSIILRTILCFRHSNSFTFSDKETDQLLNGFVKVTQLVNGRASSQTLICCPILNSMFVFFTVSVRLLNIMASLDWQLLVASRESHGKYILYF